MTTLDEVRAAKQKLLSELETRGLVGHGSGGVNVAVGIGGQKDGYVLRCLVQFAEEMPEGLPQSVDGIPATYELIGPIEAL